MKEIIAIIRSGKWIQTKTALMQEGITSYTVQRVYGRGRQKGLRYLSKTGKIEQGIHYLPKRMVTMFVNDEDADRVVALLVKTNQTGEIGDGKIFVGPLETVERVRTGETGQEVLF